jgi:hypothetical protein
MGPASLKAVFVAARRSGALRLTGRQLTAMPEEAVTLDPRFAGEDEKWRVAAAQSA